MRLIRIHFTKKGEAAYISHLDLQRVMSRALRRSGLPVWYSQGFNPHIYSSFALPLPLMYESEAEAVDCKTESALSDFSAFLQPLNDALPRGLDATKICEPVHAASEIAWADWQISCQDETLLQRAIEGYNRLPAAPVLRKTKRTETEVDLKETVPKLALSSGRKSFLVRLPAGGSLNYNPELLLRVLEERFDLPARETAVLRKAVYTKELEPFR